MKGFWSLWVGFGVLGFRVLSPMGPADIGALKCLRKVPRLPCTQRLQNPLIKEYTLNHIRVPIMI